MKTKRYCNIIVVIQKIIGSVAEVAPATPTHDDVPPATESHSRSAADTQKIYIQQREVSLSLSALFSGLISLSLLYSIVCVNPLWAWASPFVLASRSQQKTTRQYNGGANN